ncbi:lipid asymmetry ABC transporter MlaABCDEF, permease component MlaE [Arcobacter venerupis]|uniref:Lipid asymmetry ABC transporter MlaABCDEF, permease component MlaE n=1 Tax=Arcobacter venerupis TaxID=1054033 RepID=A0AAE7B5Q1_9BACT|nr:ABC transporter permease [Arcobacter venerupis]QKF65803.1 lipid asymmetry ABC transporter MlaABCDEF, permease component MlaE [Arcobacter venerupis]RWS50310.1 ABC transporter permease [Arcobacter venerupis]
MEDSALELKNLDNNTIELFLINIWNKQTLSKNIQSLKKLNIKKDSKLIVNFEKLKECDNAGIIYFISFIKTFPQENITLKNLNSYEEIYRFYEKHYQTNNQDTKIKKNLIENIGRKTHELYLSSVDFISFMGKVFYYLIYSLFNPNKIRFKAMLKYIDSSAVNALLIVGTTSFLVGVVIAYQGAVQLEKFGANIFIVEMISITMFREIAPLVTAIVIAGRSASSYAAEIGAMKITDEIDAMRTMDFEPILFLVLPRIFALLIALPLLVFFADMIGILGGMVVAYTNLDVTFLEFINRMGQEVPLKHLLIGVFKSVFFGMAIAIIGCYRGFQVQNNTTSIGKYTTISVVNAIFVVIALNAIFSVILTQIGI